METFLKHYFVSWEAPKDSCLDEYRLLQGGNNPKVNTNEQGEMAKNCEKGSDSLKEVKCAPCEEEGESKAAVKFCIDCNQSICQQCVSFHRRVKQIKDHKLVDQTNSSDLQCAQLLAQSLNCPNHQNKKIELMCKDHDVMCCLTCATVKHRNCSNVFEVADLAAENCMKTESQKYTEHLENTKQYIVDMIKLQDNHKGKLQADVDVSLLKTIKDIRRKVNAMLTSLEANIHVKSREMADEQFKRYATEKKKWKENLYSVNENIKLLETVCQSGSNVHIFIALERIQKKLFEIDHTILNQGKTLTLANGINVEEESILTDLYESISYPEQLVCLSIGEAVVYLPNYEYNYQKDIVKNTARKSC